MYASNVFHENCKWQELTMGSGRGKTDIMNVRVCTVASVQIYQSSSRY